MLFLFFFVSSVFANIYPVNPENIPEIPIVAESKATCPCALNNHHCRGGIYVDYYHNAPYSGYPANSTYLPPVDSVPVIIAQLTSIRDIVKEFIQEAGQEDSPVKKSMYVKNNFSKVRHLLRAIDRASKTKNNQQDGN